MTIEARTVRVSTGWSMPTAAADAPDLTGGATPIRWFGAPATTGLALPNASPTPSHLYAPRGLWLDDECLIVADTGNHRILIWNDPNADSHSDADLVLGQADFYSEGAQAAGRGPANGLRLPTGIARHAGRLLIADAWNHRVLVWNAFPTSSDTPPDYAIGQPDLDSVDENAGATVRPDTFYWPFGITIIDGNLWVADTGNRRVVAYAGIPEPGDKPDTILGQPDGFQRDENGGEIGPRTYRWPHDVAHLDGRYLIADAGNHRVLGWDRRPGADDDPGLILGQPDFTTTDELPYAHQSGATLRFPYAVATNPVPTNPVPSDATATGGAPRFAVADTANNRVLWWTDVPDESRVPADGVLGQPDLASIGENRWQSVAADTLCWPYGVRLHGNRLAVADSGNNRVTIWEWPT